MRILKTAALACLAVLTVLSCATTDKRALFSDAPVALVLVASNYDINWKGEEASSESWANDSVRRLLRANEDWVIITKADSIIDEAEEIIRTALMNSPFVTLAPKDIVLASPSYKEARLIPFQKNGEMICPAGYRLVYYRDKNFFPALARDTGIEKSLFITLDLTKEMSSGVGKNGNCRANAAMTVLLKDSRNKTLFNRVYEVRSIDRTKVTSGAYSQDELLELMRTAINDAVLDFLEDL